MEAGVQARGRHICIAWPALKRSGLKPNPTRFSAVTITMTSREFE